jgi:YVTN family beta-propeller protein
MNYTRLCGLFLCIKICCHAQSPEEMEAKRITLPNGWGLSPVGESLPLGDLPLNMIISPDKKYIAVTNNGQSTQSIQLIDADKQAVHDTREIKKSWLGLAFSDDSRSLYASGGNNNHIICYDIKENKLMEADTFVIGKPWPEKISIAGIALDDKKHILYTVTKENNSLYVINVLTKKIIKQVPLGGEGYTCLLSPDKKSLYISCWGCDKVILFDTGKLEVKGFVAVGDNPNDMAINKKGTFLFVANANDNSVSVIDLKQNHVIETLNAALYPNAPNGSTTNGVALSDDEKTLYIANADNNCLALFDITKPGKSVSKGFIPTGWYPSCVRCRGNMIYVANGKGFSSMANPKGPNPYKKNQKVTYQKGEARKPEEVQYIGSLFKGTLSSIPVPDEKQLSIFSQAVYKNTPYTNKDEDANKERNNDPIPFKVGDPSSIKYVFYIIKENRTYDQVLADVTGGNGDTSLLLFGSDVTPNQHKLARQYVLFDNFYVDGEVSADGHNWSTAAYATDYLEKTWPTSYGGRGGGYDAEGNREISNNKNGFIWDLCKKNNVTYRTYGEFADNYKPNIPVLQGRYCTKYTSWDESVMDTTRFRQWKTDFDSLLAIGKVPRLNTLRFINDHTEGLRLGKPSPKAHVADNDFATGLFVDYLSKSRIWKESLVFILEDDAQNGPDHVDAHRSTLYVAGGKVKEGFIDHSMYSTSSVLRTIELILGLPPMSQYDAAAKPLRRCFTDSVMAREFTAVPAQVNLFEKNVAINKWQKKSEGFDFEREDRVNDQEFNEVLWWAVKGKECPAPVRGAFIKIKKEEED